MHILRLVVTFDGFMVLYSNEPRTVHATVQNDDVREKTISSSIWTVETEYCRSLGPDSRSKLTTIFILSFL